MILDYISQITGKGFEFQERTRGLAELWASVRVARVDEPNHVIFYHPDHRAKLGYLVAHECGHVLRLHEAQPDYRKLPATGPRHRGRMVYDLENDLYRLAGRGLSAEQLGQLVSIWHEGLIRELGNMPVDMRIERWLYECYRGLRPLQQQALIEQLRENVKVLARKVREFTPRRLYHANVVMNAAYARYVGLLLGDRDYSFRYADTEFYPLGRSLADEIWESPDLGYRGDVSAIERWSQALGLDGWWEWRPI